MEPSTAVADTQLGLTSLTAEEGPRGYSFLLPVGTHSAYVQDLVRHSSQYKLARPMHWAT